MFKLELLVEDKNLGVVLRMLTGYVVDSPKIQPASVQPNELDRSDEIQPDKQQLTNGSAIRQMDIFEQYLHTLPVDTVVTIDLIKKFCKNNSFSPKSAYSIIFRALECKLLKRIAGSPGGRGLRVQKYKIIG